MKLRLVCATRGSKAAFMAGTHLGRCLRNFLWRQDFEVQLFADNTRGLPVVYNKALDDARDDPATLVFLHDDVYLADYFWPERLADALIKFDVVGLAGHTQRALGQTTWFVPDDGPAGLLSGIVAHGEDLGAQISLYGAAGKECKLMDGLFLAAESATLIEHGIRFEEELDFHFYDLDFCRQVEKAGLSMGTWSISVIHRSGGLTEPDGRWNRNRQIYQRKWGEPDVLQSW
jgi:GT2 family glycosyltransferase